MSYAHFIFKAVKFRGKQLRDHKYWLFYMIVPLSDSVTRKNRSLLFLKRNPNLARILSFILCYKFEI